LWSATRGQATRQPVLTRAAPDPSGSVLAIFLYGKDVFLFLENYFIFGKS
jgi:hypothetical protein